ncbi:MAG TPA: DUF488 domain-containing protein [Candidatus Methylomirabilis sp.]|nr:DUF488 domain-containing protein [Candidatus Methylomirabilis sp.]HSC72170.1 DUF488 domain-containing protein [Candidatus Methylomirabilis sp.]
MPDQLFTVGHSNHSIRRFIELLRSHAVVLVCDVRSTPYSRFNPQFNREALQAELRKHGLDYLFLGKELGGKPDDPGLPTDPEARHAEIAGREGFRAGLERLLEEARRRRTAIMCAEKDPAKCHRTHLICPHIPHDITIHHILADGSSLEHGRGDLGGGADPPRQPSLFQE